MRRPFLGHVAGCALAAVSIAFVRPAHAADVTFVSEDPRLAVHYDTGRSTISAVRGGRSFVTSFVLTPVYQPICAGMPCATRLEPGLYSFAVSRANGTFRRAASPPIRIDTPMTLSVKEHPDDRSLLRTAGAITAIVSAIVGVGILEAEQQARSEGSTNTDAARYTGIGVLTSGVTTGIVLMLQHDQTSFTITPVSLGALGARQGRETALAAAALNGVAMTVRF